MRNGRLSLVVPVFDEEACLHELHRRLARLPLPLEMVFVDDGSTDASFDILRNLAAADPRVRLLVLGENLGSQQALLAGMRAARGDVICTMDADLQHPPELIPGMFEAWRAGADIVEMVRRSASPMRSLRDLATPAFYRAFNLISPVPLPPRSTDFRLLDRAQALALRGHPGELLRAMVARLQAPRTRFAFDVPPRFAGRSRYDLWRLCRTGAAALGAGVRARLTQPPPAAESVRDAVRVVPAAPRARSARAGARSSAGS